jgi:hypothetical protein
MGTRRKLSVERSSRRDREGQMRNAAASRAFGAVVRVALPSGQTGMGYVRGVCNPVRF